jgi:rhamnulokinase
MRYYLAIDIGASSGRHILGHVENGKLSLEEIYRFDNYITNVNGTLCWDVDHLVGSVVEGIKLCKALGKLPATIAIDTWGVDYVLLDADQKEIFPAVAYRDSRTNTIPEEIDKIISREELYARNGIQSLNFNTIYQLYCDKLSGKLERAAHFLMMPDYLAFKITGKLANEYTNLTTGALINAKTKAIDTELLGMLGIKDDIFESVMLPSTPLGGLSEKIRNEVGFDSTVVLAASHDTASAVAACPVGDSGMYISSGTWSLIGTEITTPVLTPEALHSGFTNEGGVNYRYRFLKNFMGMWLFQNIRKNLDKKYTYDEMMKMAMESELRGYIDTNAPEFTAPENMIDAIKNYLGMPDLTVGEVLASVYHSLARSYKEAVGTIEAISGQKIELINIVGGGCKDEYLDRLTAQYTGKRVIAGPVEATATGNLITQMMYDDKSLTLADARELVKKSFNDIKEITI